METKDKIIIENVAELKTFINELIEDTMYVKVKNNIVHILSEDIKIEIEYCNKY